MNRIGPADHPTSASVLEILGLTGTVDTEAVDWAVVTPESRHSIWRLKVPDVVAAPRSYVVKSYHHQSDRYFDHRFRREERILDLAGRYAPGLAPLVHGGAIVEGHSAYLVLEDLGDRPLHVDLDGTDLEGRMRRLRQSVDLLARFHRLTDEYSGIFRAICQNSILDRVNSRTLAKRFEIAIDRLAAGLPNREMATIRAQYRQHVIRPLLSGSPRVIHNSFSPLNLCVLDDGSLRILDMETIAVGPAELDLAELLIYPGPDIGDGEHELKARYDGAVAAGEPDADSGLRLQQAAIVRALDYAGTLSSRRRRFHEEGMADLAGIQDERRVAYLRAALDRARRINLPAALVKYLDVLTSETGGGQ